MLSYHFNNTAKLTWILDRKNWGAIIFLWWDQWSPLAMRMPSPNKGLTTLDIVGDLPRSKLLVRFSSLRSSGSSTYKCCLFHMEYKNVGPNHHNIHLVIYIRILLLRYIYQDSTHMRAVCVYHIVSSISGDMEIESKTIDLRLKMIG